MRIPNSALTQRMRINVPKDYILYETHGENPHRIRAFYMRISRETHVKLKTEDLKLKT